MPIVKSVHGMEILDSRGRPTVKAYCELTDGTRGEASVPSGASTGAAEALELPDGDPRRHRGMGCLKAAAHLGGEINQALAGQEFATQAELDRKLIELDGTSNKARLGANAILALSVAFARAHAASLRQPLYLHFAQMLGQKIENFPRMTINLFSGGLHAGKQLPIQDVLIVPASASSYHEGLVVASNVYMAAVDLIGERYGMRWLTADEGGLAPPAGDAEEMIGLAVQAIERAGYEPGRDVCLALDVAASHFYEDLRYSLGERLSSEQMIDRLEQWVRRFPIVSLEDGLAEDDWEYWPALCTRLRPHCLVLGDDLLCTNPERIRRAAGQRSCNALLLKVNQIGTLTEAMEAYRLARKANWQITISVRSGDTEDNWFADLAVGWSGDQTKAGSITQSERLSKYNRLMEIERELTLPMVEWPVTRGKANSKRSAGKC